MPGGEGVEFSGMGRLWRKGGRVGCCVSCFKSEGKQTDVVRLDMTVERESLGKNRNEHSMLNRCVGGRTDAMLVITADLAVVYDMVRKWMGLEGGQVVVVYVVMMA